MLIKTGSKTLIVPALLASLLFASQSGAQSMQTVKLNPPSRMRKVAEIDPRFQSYNIEMAEVTGGRFWKPYSATSSTRATPDAKNPGVSPSGDAFQYRPPIDLTGRRVRNLARALGPAYVRVSGSWQNTTYFHDSDSPAPTQPPTGFAGVLTRPEWKGVVEFTRAVDAQIVTSVPTSGGTRDSNGVWTPKQADQFFSYTKSVGGEIAATEFMNEPTLALRAGGVPDGYSPAAYSRDNEIFHGWLRQAYPNTLFVGPGGEGEGMGWKQLPMMQRIPSEELLRATGPVFDVYSYHFYNAISARCSAFLGGGTTPEKALSAEFLDTPERVNAFYTDLRDRYVPGTPIWVTETAQAACGGDRWAATFIDTFRYLNELGTLARHGVQVVFHNTLAASDYALLDEGTFSPRPDYWAALLWHHLMGATVLDAGVTKNPQVRLYAHCLPDMHGGVTLLAINASDTAVVLDGDTPSESYLLSAPELESKSVRLNGRTLSLDARDSIPRLTGNPGNRYLRLYPRTIAFLAFRNARNPACKADVH